MMYKTCLDCGGNLDLGERCDCSTGERYSKTETLSAASPPTVQEEKQEPTPNRSK